MLAFCRSLSLAPRHPTVRRNDVDYVIFCFADSDHAESFRVQFNGAPFDPSQRGRRTRWHEWRSGSQRARDVGLLCETDVRADISDGWGFCHLQTSTVEDHGHK
jgi:hypothetical protein